MNEPAAPTICVIAAEESGDRIGAALMRALKSISAEVRICGVGGRDMLGEGLRPLVAIREIAFIGLGMVTQLRAIYRYINDVAEAVLAAEPDVLVIIDSPELTHRIARRVRQQAAALPIVNFVSPSVWAWRPGRARRMRTYVDHVLALLPFEPEVHARLGGPACTYVGHPLIEQLDELRPNTADAARRQSDPPVVLVLPGSRPGEIRRMADTFGDAIAQAASRYGPVEAVLPTVPQLMERVQAATAGWKLRPRIVAEPSAKWAAMRTARAALAKSGTVTLELALAGVPMVAAYRVSLFEEIIARATINVPSIILANLVIGETIVPEFLQRECTAGRLADALVPLLTDGPERRRQTSAFARLDEIMQTGRDAPSRRAAQIVLDHAGRESEPALRAARANAPSSA
jgi:lipid-A-disaccharide synthase